MKKIAVCAALFCTATNLFAFDDQDSVPKNKNTESAVVKSLRSESSKLDSRLIKLMSGDQVSVVIVNGKVQVRAFPAGDIGVLVSELREVGATKTKIRGKYLTSWVPVSKLGHVAKVDSLKYATAIDSGSGNAQSWKRYITSQQPTGKVVSQGDRAMLADNVRKHLGLTGKGIKIGIVSDSFNSLGNAEKSVKDGDLPGLNNPNGYTLPVNVLKEGPSNNNDEGRAMAEIIHDVAPDAEIYFYSARYGLEDFADGIRQLAAAGCDIIVDDWFYFAEPAFQDGIINQAIDEVTENGVLYFTAAGNFGNNAYDSPFVDSGVDMGGEFGRMHDFQNGHQETVTLFDGSEHTISSIPIVLQPGDTTGLYLYWDDPSILANANGDFPDGDMSIILIGDRNGKRMPVSWSVIDNTRSGVPAESNSYQNQTNQPLNLSIAIGLVRGNAPRGIKFINFAKNFGFAPFSGALVGHANAEGAFTIGSVNYWNTPQFGNQLRAAGYSSVGGATPILLDPTGNPTAPIFRNKPDLMGPDFANTSFFGNGDADNDGFPNFDGTSAAAPHVAAAAALILEKYGPLSRETVWNALTTTALDMGSDGFDFSTGHGFVQIDAAVASLDDKPSVYRLELFDQTSGNLIQTLFDGDDIDLTSQSKDINVNVRALVNNGKNNDSVNGVRLGISGSEYFYRFDSSPTYTLFEDSDEVGLLSGNYFLTSKLSVPGVYTPFDFYSFSFVKNEK
ncbi:S8 family peptidase [Aliikangiella coralliicola]|nr:S8 family serine peptidase [Aliikangiella coralliicola]